MAVGKSGRVVIEIDPELKRELHGALRREGMSLKEWFVREAHRFLDEKDQTNLRFTRPQKSVGER